ncbi:MAG: YdcF family protein [Gammaproteobacteria bacterium]|nr:YdcF family protein [Gammaproteobacteria bacterium]
MEYLLSKILPLLVYPLGLAFVLLPLAILLAWKRRGVSALLLGGLGVSVLWISAMPATSRYLRSPLEAPFPPLSVEETSHADAIVVLGGAVGEIDYSRSLFSLSDASDRVLHGLRLYKAGRAPLLILSGGSAPGVVPEAEVMVQILAELGVPRGSMLSETKSRNTYENAVYTRELMRDRGIERVLLVTSAFHMGRALATFRSQGIDAIPAATDYDRLAKAHEILNWLPDAKALYRTTLVLKEYLGMLVYRLRGWIAVGEGAAV